MKLGVIRGTTALTARKVILVQDEIAPDSLEYFSEKFKQKVGISLDEFKKKAFKVSLKMEIIYCHKNYRLSWCYDDPFYILYNDSQVN